MTQLEQLQRLLDELVAAGAPGAAAWVQGEDGSLQAAGGVADISTGRPMESRLRFRAGSLTKPLVATVVLQLVAEGRLSRTDTLEQRLPGILPYGDRVSIRQLLNTPAACPTTGQPSNGRCTDPDRDASATGPAGAGRSGSPMARGYSLPVGPRGEALDGFFRALLGGLALLETGTPAGRLIGHAGGSPATSAWS